MKPSSLRKAFFLGGLWSEIQTKNFNSNIGICIQPAGCGNGFGG